MRYKLSMKLFCLSITIILVSLLICYPVRAELSSNNVVQTEITLDKAKSILRDFDDYFIYEYLPNGDYVESDSIKERFYIFRVTDSYDYEADFYFCVDKDTSGLYVYYSSGYLVKLDVKMED